MSTPTSTPVPTPTPIPVPTRAGTREWAGLAVLALPALLVALDIGVLFLALPQLSADLGATATQQLWITDSYGFLLAGCLVTMGTLPEHRSGAGRIDLPGVLLSLAAVLPIVWAVKELALGGSSVAALPVLAVGVAAGRAFVRRQAGLAAPLVDLTLLRDRRVGATLLAMAAGSAALAGASLMTSQYVQSVVGLSPAAAGVWLAPTGLGIAAGVLLAPALARYGAAGILAGLAVSAAGLALPATVHRPDALGPGGNRGRAGRVRHRAAVRAGHRHRRRVGPVERAGAAASLSETGNILGSTLGLALLGSVGAAVHRHGLPDGPGTIAAARAADLPAGALAAAQDAFTAGMAAVAGVGLVLLAAAAVLVTRAARA